MKAAIAERVIAITATCPDCGAACQNDSGSQFLEKDEHIICSECGQDLKVPQSPFYVRVRRSRQVSTC
jgi:rRNA maturation protein Nop10